MASFKFHEKKLLRKFKIDNSKITPQGRTMHTLYPVNHLIKTTPESTLGLHFVSFKLQHQLLRNLKFYQLYSFGCHCTLLVYTPFSPAGIDGAVS